MRRLYNLLLLFLFTTTTLLGQITHGVQQADYDALVALYNSTSGGSWTTSAGWNTAADVSTWSGVTCVGDRVTEVDLSSNNVAGTLPADLNNLTALTNLNISGNSLTGNLPDFSGTALTDLNLSNNQLTALGNLPTSVTNLNISNNTLTGAVPDLSSLAALTDLNLSNNQLTALGNLPTSVTNLNLSNNTLSGAVPDLSSLAALTDLNLSNNQLTALGNLPTSVTNLNLSNNTLTGAVPDLSSLVALTDLNLSNNQLTGLGNLPISSIVNLNLSNNQFAEITIPAFTTIAQLDLSNNQLTSLNLSAITNSNMTSVSVWGNQIDLCSMDDLYNLLPYQSGIADIYIKNGAETNPGADDSNISLANGKNWQVQDNNAGSPVVLSGGSGCIHVTGVSIDQGEGELTFVGETINLTATVEPNNATIPTVQWTTSDAAVATVNSTGVVETLSEGTSTITVTTDDQAQTDTYTLDVRPATPPAGTPYIVLNTSNGESINMKYVASSPNQTVWIETSPGTYEVDVAATGSIESATQRTWVAASNQMTIHGNNIQAFLVNNNSANITGIDASASSSLTQLYCRYNQIVNLSVPASLETLDCENNQIQNLDVSSFTNLRTLNCSNNNLQSLILNTNLQSLDCNNNTNLSSLDLTANANLQLLNCSNTNLQNINLSNNASLTFLNCSNTNLQNINLSNNASLTNLNCSNAKLNSLDITANTSLNVLNCSNNNLNELNISTITNVTNLDCSNNNIAEITIPAFTTIAELDLSNNQLTSLDLSAITNSNMTSVSVWGNQIDLCSMDDLYKSLPNQSGTAYIYIKNGAETNPGADDSKKLLANNKNWEVVDYNAGSPVGLTGGAGCIRVTGVSLNKSNLALIEGKTEALTATVEPNNATIPTIQWTTSDAAVATVNATGVVTAVAAGNATITVTTDDQNKTAQCQVEVVSAPTATTPYITVTKTAGSTVNQIKVLAETAGEVVFVETAPDTYEIIKANKRSSDAWAGTSHSFTTAGTELKVYGNITAFRCSNNAAKVTGVDVSHTTLLKYLVVHGNEITSLDVSQNPELTYLYLRSNLLDACAMDALYKSLPDRTGLTTSRIYVQNGASQTNPGAASSKTTFATQKNWQVRDNRYGLFYGDGTGCSTSGSVAATGVSFNESSLTVYAGIATDLTDKITLSPSDATNKNVRWESSNTDAATIDSDGKLTGIVDGETTITVTTEDGGFTATCTVTVIGDHLEANNSRATAYDLGDVSTFVDDKLNLHRRDRDYFKYTYKGSVGYIMVRGYSSSTTGDYGLNFKIENDNLTVFTYPPDGITAVDTKLYLYNADGKEVGFDDDDGAGNFSRISISLLPVADAGKDLASLSNKEMRLNGSNSSCVVGSLTYSWESLDGISLSATDESNPSFTTPYGTGVYRFALTVSAAGTTSKPDTVNVTVAPETPPYDAPYVTLTKGANKTIYVRAAAAKDGTPYWVETKSGVYEVHFANDEADLSGWNDGTYGKNYTTEGTEVKVYGNITKLRSTNMHALTGIDVSHNTLLEQLLVYNELLTELDVSNNVNLKDIRLYGNKLDACALDAFFKTLPDRSGKSSGSISMYSNTGTNTSKTGFAAQRHWNTDRTGDGTGCSTSGEVELSGVAISPSNIQLKVGDTYALTARLLPTDVSNKESIYVQWTSDNWGVASVTSEGEITANYAGTATIKVTTTPGSYEAVCNVTVTAAEPPYGTPYVTLKTKPYRTIKIATAAAANNTPVWVETEEGKYQTMLANKYSGTNVSGNYSFNTSLSETKIYGDITKLKVADQGTNVSGIDVSNNANIEVLRIPNNAIKSLDVSNQSNLYYLEIYGNQFDACTLNDLYESLPDRSDTTIGKLVILKGGASNPGAATSKTELATADKNWAIKAQGSDNEIDYAGDGTGCKKVQSISLDETSLTMIPSYSAILTATVSPSDATNTNVLWSSSNKAVATVNASGLVSAVAPGSATITATTEYGNKTATCAVSVVKPQYSIPYTNLDFGDLRVNTYTNWDDNQFVVKNTGSVPLRIKFSKSSYDYNNFNSNGINNQPTIQPGDEYVLQLRFNPQSKGEKTTSFTFYANTNDDGSWEETTINLKGNGIQADFAVDFPSSASYDFGDVWVGNNATKTYTITNNGTADLAITGYNVASAVYSMSPATPFTVAPGKSKEITLTFEPTGNTSYSNSLRIYSQNSGSKSIHLSGNGIKKAVVEMEIENGDDFGYVKLGETATKVLTIKNTGNKFWQITSINSPSGGDFSTTVGWGTEIQAGEEKTFEILYTPSSAGSQSSYFEFVGNIPSSPMITVQGTGAYGEFSIDATNHDFGNIAFNASVSQEFTITNNGQVDLVLNNFVIGGADAAEFSTDAVNGKTLKAGETYTFNVAFNPVNANPKSATLTIAQDDGTGDKVINLTGTGIAAPFLLVSPMAKDFGKVAPNTSVSQNFTITNSGNTPLTFTNNALSGAAWFTTTPATLPTSSLAAGASHSFKVTFKPTSEDYKTASIAISSNAGNKTIALSGSGHINRPDFAMTPESYAFGDVLLGSTAEEGITIYNNGDADLSVSGFALSGANASEFTTNGAAKTIAGGESYMFKVTFKPTSEAAGKKATLTVTENGNTHTIALSGNGKVIHVDRVALNPSTLQLVVGASGTLLANVYPSDAANTAISWKSSDESVATVDNTGKVTAVKTGEATITITSEDGSKTAESIVTVVVPVESVSLDVSEKTLKVGEEFTLAATVLPANATNKEVSWRSSSSFTASVDANGKVTALRTGTATITVATQEGNKTATCVVTVVQPVESVSLNATEKMLYVGDEFTLRATVLPYNATNSNVAWSSSDAAVAKVEDGKVTALAAGEATITVTTEDGAMTATCKLTVGVHVESVTLDATEKTIKEGEEFTLVATLAPANATVKDVSWSSSSSYVASVDQSGKVTAKSQGTTTISVVTKDGYKTARCVVTVTKLTGFEVTTITKLSVYPNPVATGFYVESENNSSNDLQVFGANGNKVYEQKITKSKEFIDVNHLPAGTYIVKVGSETVRIIKE